MPASMACGRKILSNKRMDEFIYPQKNLYKKTLIVFFGAGESVVRTFFGFYK